MRPVIRIHACDYHRSAAHSAQWQELELILRQLLQHVNMLEKRERVVYASLSPAETFMRACRRPTEAARFHRSKVFTICSALPYHIDTQNTVCATYCTYIRKHLLAYFSYMETLTRMRGLHNGEIHFTSMDAILNDRSKLKRQYTDVKSGSSISIGPSLKPHSLGYNKILVTLSR